MINRQLFLLATSSFFVCYVVILGGVKMAVNHAKINFRKNVLRDGKEKRGDCDVLSFCGAHWSGPTAFASTGRTLEVCCTVASASVKQRKHRLKMTKVGKQRIPISVDSLKFYCSVTRPSVL